MYEPKKNNTNSIFLKIISAVYGLAILVFAFYIYSDLKNKGFPDGHLTDYDKAVKLPLTICNFINILCAIYFFYLAIINVPKQSRKLLFAIIVHLIFALFITYGMYYYYKIILGLENGQGG